MNITSESEKIFAFSNMSLKGDYLTVKYWYDGYAICKRGDNYYWLRMPAENFIYNDHILRDAALQPVCDNGTFEIISFFIEAEQILKDTPLQPVSCKINTAVQITISDVILYDCNSCNYFACKAAMLMELSKLSIASNKSSSLISPIIIEEEQQKC